MQAACDIEARTSGTECQERARLSVIRELRGTEFPSGTVLSCGLSVPTERRTLPFVCRMGCYPLPRSSDRIPARAKKAAALLPTPTASCRWRFRLCQSVSPIWITQCRPFATYIQPCTLCNAPTLSTWTALEVIPQGHSTICEKWNMAVCWWRAGRPRPPPQVRLLQATKRSYTKIICRMLIIQKSNCSRRDLAVRILPATRRTFTKDSAHPSSKCQPNDTTGARQGTVLYVWVSLKLRSHGKRYKVTIQTTFLQLLHPSTRTSLTEKLQCGGRTQVVTALKTGYTSAHLDGGFTSSSPRYIRTR